MRWIPTILLLLGCPEESALLPDLPRADFHVQANSHPLQLDRLPAQVVVNPGTRSPQPLQFPPHWDLQSAPTPQKDNVLGANLRVELPFQVNANDARFAPEAMTVHVGDTKLPYSLNRRSAKNLGTGWKIRNDALLLLFPYKGPPPTVRIRTPEFTTLEQRLTPEHSALPLPRFIQYSAHREDISHTGLLLTAPMSATWRVQLPSNAQFKTHARILELPMESTGLDGSTITLSVTESGHTETISTLAVTRGTSETPWQVDLGKYAGKEVEVHLSTDSQSDPRKDFVFLASPVILDTNPAFAPRRVIFIGLDTTRPDHLGVYDYPKDTSPALDALSEHFTIFDHAYAPAPRTRPSFRAATTGKTPLNAVGAKTAGAIFDESGFATAGIVANIHLNRRFGFHEGYDFWHLNTKAKATEQVDLALDWLGKNIERDTFLFLHLMDPHLFYDAPRRYSARFPTEVDASIPERFTRQMLLKRMRNNTLTETGKKDIVARYDREIAYTTDELARFIQSLDALPGQNLVVIFSDHGEEFWEHDGFEHNHTLYDEVTRAVLMIRPPPGHPHAARSIQPATLQDVLPTALAYTGILNTALDGISLRSQIDGGEPNLKRPLGIGHLMYDKEQWGVVLEGKKYVIETASGREVLFELKTDPAETRNIASQHDLKPYREALASVHDMPVGPGWRIQLSAEGGSAPITIKLPQPCLDAGVIPPESTRTRRANLVWGDSPRHTSADIASIALNSSRDEVTITPGPYGKGLLYVLFDTEVAVAGTVRVAEQRTTIPSTGMIQDFSSASFTILPGQIVVPPPDEATRIIQLSTTAKPSTSEVELLQTLGYLEAPETPTNEESKRSPE